MKNRLSLARQLVIVSFLVLPSRFAVADNDLSRAQISDIQRTLNMVFQELNPCYINIGLGRVPLLSSLWPGLEYKRYILKDQLGQYEELQRRGYIRIQITPAKDGFGKLGEIGITSTEKARNLIGKCPKSNPDLIFLQSSPVGEFKKLVDVESYKGGGDNYAIALYTFEGEDKSDVFRDVCESFPKRYLQCHWIKQRKGRCLLKNDKFNDEKPWARIACDIAENSKEFTTENVPKRIRELDLQSKRR